MNFAALNMQVPHGRIEQGTYKSLVNTFRNTLSHDTNIIIEKKTGKTIKHRSQTYLVSINNQIKTGESSGEIDS